MLEAPLNQRPVQSFIAVAAVGACLFFAFHYPKLSETERSATPTNEPASLILDLNSASRLELSLVPGIGPVMARRIIENRDRLGDFPSLDSLQRVHGVGPRTIERVSTICVVTDPPRLASKHP